jgi:biotin transport system substrate-specific component
MGRDTVISIVGIDKAAPENPQEGFQVPAPGLDSESEHRRPLLQRASYPPRISLNGILVGLLCTLLLVVIGFVPVSLPSPLNIGGHAAAYSQLSMIQYTCQLPLALFIGALLGPFMGTASVLLFVLVGLGVEPVFANGGGWQYVTQPGFGYLLGAVIMAYLVGKTFHKAFLKQDNASRSLKLFGQAIAAVAVLHLLGMLYLVGLSVLGQLPWSELPGWMLRLSVETAPYDLLSTAIFLCMVRQIRLALWLVLY